ncbi:MAG: hypothetical protein IJX08_05405 [Clostridia bacterium]|nr:hypothetical protein [Clostridia bacterium]
MKKQSKCIAAFVLLAVLMLSFAGCKEQPSDAPVCFEGAGYESAEKAAQAYADAFLAADLDAMIASFAVETFVESYDLDEYVKLRKYYNYGYTEYAFENSGDFQTKVNYYSRVGDLVNDFKQQYLYLVLEEYPGGSMETMAKWEDTAIEQYLDVISDPSFEEKMSKASIHDFLTPETIEGVDASVYERTISNYSHLACEEVTSYAIELDFDGEEYYLFVDVGCFDGVWYNISVNSSLGVCVGAEGGNSIMHRAD